MKTFSIIVIILACTASSLALAQDKKTKKGAPAMSKAEQCCQQFGGYWKNDICTNLGKASAGAAAYLKCAGRM